MYISVSAYNVEKSISISISGKKGAARTGFYDSGYGLQTINHTAGGVEKQDPSLWWKMELTLLRTGTGIERTAMCPRRSGR